MTCNFEGITGIHPDGFTGALLAGESILDGAVILHGPTGCRGHHSALSERAFPRDDVEERLNFMQPFYFGQPRIPTTYLDGDDFVFGAREKLVKAIRETAKQGPALITIINSPGAALIGDNISQATVESGAEVPCATVEMPGLSCSLAEGYQQGLIAVLEALSPVRRGRGTAYHSPRGPLHCLSALGGRRGGITSPPWPVRHQGGLRPGGRKLRGRVPPAFPRGMLCRCS